MSTVTITQDSSKFASDFLKKLKKNTDEAAPRAQAAQPPATWGQARPEPPRPARFVPAFTVIETLPSLELAEQLSI